MPLPGSVLQKIGRAREHIDALELELNRYFNSIPCHISAEIDPDGDQVFARLITETPIPVRVALIIGDCLQNLRTSLDYLIWELVLAANNVPGERNAFPVCLNPQKFKKAVGDGRLDGMAEDAKAVVEACQPYSDSRGTEGGILVVLNDLTNINKHRRILLTVLNPFLTRDPIVGTVREGEAVRLPYVREPLTQATMRRSITGEIEMDAYATVNVSFRERRIEGLEVVRVLERIATEIENGLMPLFERFF